MKFFTKCIFGITFLFAVLIQLHAQPNINSFSPLTAKPGDAVKITGTNFNITAANNMGFFGATQSTVTALRGQEHMM